MSDDLAQLNQRMDYLIQMVETQQKQLHAVAELKQDVMPIVTSITRIMIDELEELGEDFQIEDVTFLGKRLLRKNRLLLKMMDRMEALMDLIDELEFLGKHVFNDTVQSLESLENKGYFKLAQEGGAVADRLVAEVSVEDVRQAGGQLSSMIKALRMEPRKNESSLWGLIKSIFDPNVRKGMARMLNVLKVLGN